jgi:hypothetical protein
MVRCIGVTTLYERTKRGLDFPSTNDGLSSSTLLYTEKCFRLGINWKAAVKTNSGFINRIYS